MLPLHDVPELCLTVPDTLPQDLLRGIYPRIILGTSNWARHLASKLFAHWRSNMLWKFSDPPFLVAKDEDAAIIYSTLPSLARYTNVLQSSDKAFACRSR